MIKVLAALIVICVVSACETVATIEVTKPDGTKIKITGASGQSNAATLTLGENLIANTGGEDQSLSDLSQSANWLAIALIVAGIGSIVVSMWIPMIPRSTSMILIAAGAGVWAFPVLIDRYSVYLMIGLGALGLLWGFGMWDNRRKINVGK